MQVPTITASTFFILKKSSIIPPSGTPFWPSITVSNWQLKFNTAIVEFTLTSNHARVGDFRRALQEDFQEDVPNEPDQAFVYSTVHRGALHFVSPTTLRILSATHSEDVAFWKAKLEVLHRCGFELPHTSIQPITPETNPFQNSHGGQLIGLGVEAQLGRQLDLALIAVTLASHKKLTANYDPRRGPPLKLALPFRARKLLSLVDANGRVVFLTGPPLDVVAVELVLELLVCFPRDKCCPPPDNTALQTAYYEQLSNPSVKS